MAKKAITFTSWIRIRKTPSARGIWIGYVIPIPSNIRRAYSQISEMVNKPVKVTIEPIEE